jgi:hypothetical protein
MNAGPKSRPAHGVGLILHISDQFRRREDRQVAAFAECG